MIFPGSVFFSSIWCKKVENNNLFCDHITWLEIPKAFVSHQKEPINQFLDNYYKHSEKFDNSSFNESQILTLKKRKNTTTGPQDPLVNYSRLQKKNRIKKNETY